MSWAGKQHPIETLVEWTAPIPLAAAVGWAAVRLGFPAVLALALGAIALAGGLAAIRAVGRAGSSPGPQFQPPAIGQSESELGELLLEAKDEILLLDDPLIEPGGDSRVVRLFARAQPTPGELAQRIEGFLGEVGRTVPPVAADRFEQRPVDASAALHAALANVRASLR